MRGLHDEKKLPNQYQSWKIQTYQATTGKYTQYIHALRPRVSHMKKAAYKRYGAGKKVSGIRGKHARTTTFSDRNHSQDDRPMAQGDWCLHSCNWATERVNTTKSSSGHNASKTGIRYWHKSLFALLLRNISSSHFHLQYLATYLIIWVLIKQQSILKVLHFSCYSLVWGWDSSLSPSKPCGISNTGGSIPVAVAVLVSSDD